MFFFMKKLMGVILSQNHRRSKEGGPGVKKSYFNPIKHFFSKTFQNNFFPKQTFFPNFTKIAQRQAALPPDPPSVTRLSTLAFSTRLLS